MENGKGEDLYIIRPDAFGRFEVYVKQAGAGTTRPQGRFSTVEAAQAWIDRRTARMVGVTAEAPMQPLLHDIRPLPSRFSRS